MYAELKSTTACPQQLNLLHRCICNTLTTQPVLQTNNGVVIEIYLWRADMLCGILEV
jgi:hypothetical protein